jgi:hypothetical protein
MLKPIAITLLALIFIGCAGSTETSVAEEQELSDLERIAKAHGVDNFANTNFLQYTFNVQRDTSISSRTWNWHPKTGEILAINKGDSIKFTQADVTEELKRTDHSFINDKYWLLFPFQLVWDAAITATNAGKQIAPISGSEMTKITIQYGNEGGYTPGDAYDIYVDDNWVIREWAFRRSGQEEPNLVTTWQDYVELRGMLIATNHLNKDGSFRLFFSDIEIK